MPTAQTWERELTLKEAAQALGVEPYRLAYAFRTRNHIPRRMAGNTTLVTLPAAQRALASLRAKRRAHVE